MARKKKVQVETPPSTAPKRWKGILAEHWQSQGGKWAAPQHYNCTYMAMFPPALPHYFIRRFTEPKDIVLDPFSGRGTTAVEAMAQGRFGIGNDLNDYLAMKLCGYTVCPADSHSKIKDISNVTLRTNGGNGVVREILEDVLNLDFIKILYKK